MCLYNNANGEIPQNSLVNNKEFIVLVVFDMSTHFNSSALMKTFCYASVLISICAASTTPEPGINVPVIDPLTLENGQGQSIDTWKSSGVNSLNDPTLKEVVRELFRLHNDLREKYSCTIKFTCLSEKLSLYAVNASYTQIAKQKSAHYDDDQRCDAYNAWTCSENLAGNRPRLEPENIVSNWNTSDVHRQNIIGTEPITPESESKRETIGIGIAQDPDTNKYWITAIYVRRRRNEPCDPLSLD
jgi:hypothetical protein